MSQTAPSRQATTNAVLSFAIAIGGILIAYAKANEPLVMTRVLASTAILLLAQIAMRLAIIAEKD